MSDPKRGVDGGHPAIMKGDAWRELCETLMRAERFVLGDEVPDTPRDRAEGFRYLTRFLQAGLQSCITHDDPDHPVLGRMMDYTWPWGLDNPDCLYLYAPLRGDATYRLWGNRGSANHIDIQANTGHYAEGRVSAWRTMDSMDGFALETDPDGEFELVLSAEKPTDGAVRNWLRLEPDAGFLLIRQYFDDWERERPADLLIERVGAEYPIPPPRTEFVAEHLEKLCRWLDQGAELWESMSKGFLGMEPNSLMVHMPDQAGVHSGMRGLAYGMGNFHCDPGEVVIVEVDVPRCHHWGIALANFYWEAIEFGTRQASINGSQAHFDGDGVFRAVIAHEDPGVPNWLDTAGHPRGTLTLRFLNAEAGASPRFQRLPASELRSALPDDTPQVSPEARAATLRRRYHAVLRRYRR